MIPQFHKFFNQNKKRRAADDILIERRSRPLLIKQKTDTEVSVFYLCKGYEKDILTIFRMNSNSCKNEILADARMKSSALPQMKLNPSLSPDEVGFHHEVISSHESGIYPVRKDGFS